MKGSLLFIGGRPLIVANPTDFNGRGFWRALETSLLPHSEPSQRTSSKKNIVEQRHHVDIKMKMRLKRDERERASDNTSKRALTCLCVEPCSFCTPPELCTRTGFALEQNVVSNNLRAML